jgi:Family of unknown function (DUF6653)
MGIEHRVANLFNMTEENWECHANPLSVWTRYLTLPLLAGIVWSRCWLGIWCLIPLGLSFIWVWINPRCFPKPKTTKSWASKATLGERVWLNRNNIPIPKHQSRMPNALAVCAALGIIPLLYGLYYFDLSLTLWGLFFINVFKTWFLDRVVLLYEEMKHKPEYASWEY